MAIPSLCQPHSHLMRTLWELFADLPLDPEGHSHAGKRHLNCALGKRASFSFLIVLEDQD